MNENNIIVPYAPVIIRLLQGIVYNDDRELWEKLVTHEAEIKNYFGMIGLTLTVFEAEGFAFLKQKESDPDAEEIDLPHLMEKRQLSYPVTLLCVLLREKLVEFDLKGGDSSRLIIGKEEIKEMVRIFLPEKTNEAKLIDSIDTQINKLIDYGFLRRLNNSEDKFEVKRILKAKIPAESLLMIKNRLEEYAKNI